VQDRTTLARQERAEFVELLEQLTPQQWDAPTLCSEWQVRHVVAHVFSYDDLSGSEVVRRLVQGRFRLDRINKVCLAELSAQSPAKLTALARRCVQPRGLTAGFRGAIALVDGMIHQQDIRRPLDLPRTIPPERLRSTLDFAKTSPAIRGFWHRRGLRLVATDLDWSVGTGPEVTGTGEALLMAIAGRRVSIDELAGPGRPLLRRHLGSSP
jgi:uncharacterized protein (TIGR03083 family)